jgi:hypothetical protein
MSKNLHEQMYLSPYLLMAVLCNLLNLKYMEGFLIAKVSVQSVFNPRKYSIKFDFHANTIQMFVLLINWDSVSISFKI